MGLTKRETKRIAKERNKQLINKMSNTLFEFIPLLFAFILGMLCTIFIATG